MADSQLGKFHSCLKLARAFRACPMALAGMESLRPLDDKSRDDPEEAPHSEPPRTQEAISQPGLDQALVRLLDGFRTITDVPLSPGVPVPGGKKATPVSEPGGVLEGLPPGIVDLVMPTVNAALPLPNKIGDAPGVLSSLTVEQIWRSVISDSVESTSANAGVFSGSVPNTLRDGSETLASNIALRIAESFIGRLLSAGFNPSGRASPLSESSTSTSTPPKESSGANPRTIAGLATAGAATVGAGILFASGRGRGGGRGVSSPSPRGAGGKFFEAGKKFPILNPAR